MPTKIRTYTKTLASGEVKTYEYEVEVPEKGPRKKFVRPKKTVSKKALLELIKGFSPDDLSKMIELAKQLGANKTPQNSKNNADSDDETEEVYDEKNEISGVHPSI